MRKKQSLKISRFVAALVASMVTVSVLAQTQAPSARPRLVVGIMVDGLSEDYLQLLKGYFGDNGFRRLMRDGLLLENVDYGPGIDATAATAMIYTGAPVAVNGIPASAIYDAEKRRTYPILLDPTKIGNYTDETYSPTAILVSTLGDEVRVDGGGIGQVHAIAPDASKAIIMAGHAGNSAFWLNELSGKWASTTYYKDVPTAISAVNYRTPLSSRLDTMSWTPTMELEQYPDLPKYKRYYPFRYTFPRKDKDRYRAYKASPKINSELTSIATEYITTMSLGSHEAIDMLNIAYTLEPYPYAKDADHRLEMMDSYIKLDADLARLFNAIDRNVGLNNSLIFLAGTPMPPGGKRDDEKWGIPSGEFSPRRAISLLNVYLMAIHGNGEWVQGYHNRQLFLNHKLIKEQNKDIKSLRADAADFLSRMSGVSSVYTIDDISNGRAGRRGEALKRNTSLEHAGDLHITVNPGWEVVEDDGASQKRTTQRIAATTAPVFILSPSLSPERVIGDIDACVIAPTIARLLRIRSPNAAEMPPLRR